MNWKVSKNPLFYGKMIAIGGIGGALCDQIHVQGQVLWYPQVFFAGQAWWVAPNFGLATVLMYLCASMWAPAVERAEPPLPDNGHLIRQALWFLVAYGLSAGMQQKPYALCAIYAVLLVRRMVQRRDVVPQLVNAACLAVGGTLFENVLAGTGAFHYRDPQLGNVPIWLPGIYLHGGPLAMAVVRRVRAAQGLT